MWQPKGRCGECDNCIEFDLRYLSEMELSMWLEADGDRDKYQIIMLLWADYFVEHGVPA